MSPLVSVVIVNYRSASDTCRAVAALYRAEPGLALEVIVVDNASGPAEVAVLAALERIRLIANPRNEGFGRASNRGAAAAAGRFLLFLNPDVEAGPGSVSRLLAAAERHPEAAIFAPRLSNPDGSPQHNARRFYGWRTVLVRRSPLGRWLADSAENRRHLYRDLDPGTSAEVDWALGAALLVRAGDFARLGGFDPRFFLYFEDVDLALRAWRIGRAVRVEGEAAMAHAHRRASAGWRSLAARSEHVRSMLRFRSKHRGWPRRVEPAPGQTLVFLQHGAGAMAERAEVFARALGGTVLAKDALPGGRAARAVGAALRVLELRPRRVWILDIGVASFLVLAAARVVRAAAVIDTGDEHYELLRRTARRSGLGLELAGAVERASLALAGAVAARGRGHVAALLRRGYNGVRWIPDGVEVARYRDANPHPWRAARGWERSLVVASVGSLLVDQRYRSTQGMDLCEALALAPGVRGAIVGGGPGLPLLEARARALGLEERIAFLGQVQPRELPALIKSFDICLSTQTSDPVGEARTTGKLPLFCAAGRFVLASRVGEAARILPDAMLLRYDGEHDPAYPARLGRRLAELDADRSPLALGAGLVARAEELFAYHRLAVAVRALAAEVEESGR